MFISTMLRVEEIVWQSSPGEDSQGSSFIFTSEEVAYSSSCFCILQRGWLNSAKTEEYSLLCWLCWEKQTNSCAFAWSRSSACQEAVLASKRVCRCSVLAFSPLTYLWGISFPAHPPYPCQCFLCFLLFIVLPPSALPYYAFPSPCLYKFPLMPRQPPCVLWDDESVLPAPLPALLPLSAAPRWAWWPARRQKEVPSRGYSPCAALFPSWGMPRHPLINSSECR